MDPGRKRCDDRGSRLRAEDHVLGDQRPVEVARNGLDLAREVLWEVQPCGFVRKSTRFFRSAGGSDLYDFGITFLG